MTLEKRVPVMPVRRVLVGLGSAGADVEILDMASELAAALEAELAGLFVEEELLYQISELPMSSTVGAHGQIMQRLDRTSIGQVIAGRAQACRRALSLRAERSHVPWSFDIEQGDAVSIIGTRVKGDDILLVTGTVASTTPRAKMELARQMKAAPGANLIVPDRLRRRSGPIAVLDSQDNGNLDLALKVAESLAERLIVVALGERGKVAPVLSSGKISRVTIWHPAQIATALSRLQPRLVVASHFGTIFMDTIQAGELLLAAGAPILLVNS
jgi:hypothetical protein